MSKETLKEFFDISNVDISEFIGEPKVLSFQILHLYHNIMRWYLNRKLIKFNIYIKLLEYKDIINDIRNLHEIPFELCARYLSLIMPHSGVGKYKNTEQIIMNIKYIEDIGYGGCNAIYIKSYNNKFYIIFLCYYSNTYIIIDVETLIIKRHDTINRAIDEISMICNNKFEYQIAYIAYTPQNNTY